jgi:hypothetical protein
VSALDGADATLREQYTVAVWNHCLFGRSSLKAHPEWLALVSGFRLNGVKLDVSRTFVKASLTELFLVEILPRRRADHCHRLQWLPYHTSTASSQTSPIQCVHLAFESF